jgi:hypothetical protein
MSSTSLRISAQCVRQRTPVGPQRRMATFFCCLSCIRVWDVMRARVERSLQLVTRVRFVLWTSKLQSSRASSIKYAVTSPGLWEQCKLYVDWYKITNDLRSTQSAARPSEEAWMANCASTLEIENVHTPVSCCLKEGELFPIMPTCHPYLQHCCLANPQTLPVEGG